MIDWTNKKRHRPTLKLWAMMSIKGWDSVENTPSFVWKTIYVNVSWLRCLSKKKWFPLGELIWFTSYSVKRGSKWRLREQIGRARNKYYTFIKEILKVIDKRKRQNYVSIIVTAISKITGTFPFFFLWNLIAERQQSKISRFLGKRFKNYHNNYFTVVFAALLTYAS